MASQRWVSEMQSQDAMPSGLGQEEVDDSTADILVDNVVPLFGPRPGSLASLIAAAAGPTQPHELLGESDIRATFRAVMRETPPATARRRNKLAPFAIAAGSVAGLVAGTAGLSAAAVLPPAANHVVDQVLRQVGIDVAPAGSLTAGTSTSRSSNSHGQSQAQSQAQAQAQAARHARQHGAGSNSSSAPVVTSGVATPKLTTPKPTSPPKLASPPTQAAAAALCEVAVVQNHVVLLRLPTSSISGRTKPIANAILLSAASPCAKLRITPQDLAAAKYLGSGGTGGSSGPGTGGGSGGTTTGGTGGTGGTGTGGTGTGTGGGSSGGGTGTGKGTNGGGSGKGTNGGGSGGGKGHGKGHQGGGSGGGTTTPPTTTPPTTTPPPSPPTTSTTPPAERPTTAPATAPGDSTTPPAVPPADPATEPADPATTSTTASTTTP